MNEIEEFLKRAAAMRARQQANRGAAQPATPAPSPSAPPAAANRPARLAPLSQRPSLDDVQEAEVVDVEPVSGDDVAEYVTRHLDSAKFRERSSQLGEQIKSSDEVLEAHLHQTFEHRLGQLGSTTARAEDSVLDEDELAAARLAAAAAAPSFDFRTLLQSPQSLRIAVLMSEILTPPHHRW